MKKIEVKFAQPAWYYDNKVSVYVNGYCSHEEIEFERNLDDEQIMICARCEAWRYVDNYLSDEWYDEFMHEDKFPVIDDRLTVFKKGWT